MKYKHILVVCVVVSVVALAFICFMALNAPDVSASVASFEVGHWYRIDFPDDLYAKGDAVSFSCNAYLVEYTHNDISASTISGYNVLEHDAFSSVQMVNAYGFVFMDADVTYGLAAPCDIGSDSPSEDAEYYTVFQPGFIITQCESYKYRLYIYVTAAPNSQTANSILVLRSLSTDVTDEMSSASSTYSVTAPSGCSLSPSGSGIVSGGSYSGKIVGGYGSVPILINPSGTFDTYSYNPFTGDLNITGITSNITLSVTDPAADQALLAFKGTNFDYVGTRSVSNQFGIVSFKYDDGVVFRVGYSGSGSASATLVFKSKKPGTLLNEDAFSNFVVTKYTDNGISYDISTEMINDYCYVYVTLKTDGLTSNTLTQGWFEEQVTPKRYTVHFYLYSSNAYTITVSGDVVAVDSDIGTVTYSGTAGSRIVFRWSDLPTQYEYTRQTQNGYGLWFGSPQSAIIFMYSFGDNKYDVSTVTIGTTDTQVIYSVKIEMYNSIMSTLMQQKYNEGYQDGIDKNSDVWSERVQQAYNSGRSDGYDNGYSVGIEQASDYSFTSLFNSLANVPTTVLGGFLDFNLLGTTARNIIFCFISIALVISVVILIKKFRL